MSQKINHIGFGSYGRVQKSRNYRNEVFEGSPMSKANSYNIKLEQNNITELSISLPLEFTIKMNHKLQNM